jgi:hypothetical protein
MRPIRCLGYARWQRGILSTILVVARSKATKQSNLRIRGCRPWIASLALAMTAGNMNSRRIQFFRQPIPNTRPHSRGAMRPSCAKTTRPRNLSPKQRAWGMPGARRTRSLVCKGWWSTRVSSPKVAPEHPAFPHAMVLTVSSVLSPATNSSCHRHPQIKVLPDPVGPTSPPRI